MTELSPLKLFPILDFEASSLADCSYPISAGLVIQDQTFYWLIKPKPEWVDWSLASQAIHGLKRSFLIDQGTDADIVYEELKKLLNSFEAVYSDNPYWEDRWLRALGPNFIEVRDIRELIPIQHQNSWKALMQKQFEQHNLIAHRADHDALAMSLTANILNHNQYE